MSLPIFQVEQQAAAPASPLPAEARPRAGRRPKRRATADALPRFPAGHPSAAAAAAAAAAAGAAIADAAAAGAAAAAGGGDEDAMEFEEGKTRHRWVVVLLGKGGRAGQRGCWRGPRAVL